MGSKKRYGEEDWEYSDFQARRNERENGKLQRRIRKETRKRKKMEESDD